MTQDDIIEMARKAGFVVTHIGDPIGTNYTMIETLANLVAAKATAVEREACAKVCDELHWPWRIGDNSGPKQCAIAIRARGEQA